jgi:hypothetical protein
MDNAIGCVSEDCVKNKKNCLTMMSVLVVSVLFGWYLESRRKPWLSL